MAGKILDKIRRLNGVLTESTSGRFSYDELGKILCEVINANVYITGAQGKVLGVGYINEEDTSTVVNEMGEVTLQERHVKSFMKIKETLSNLIGEEATRIFGDDYPMTDKYHCIIPTVCGGERLGTLIVARYENSFDEEDLALCEYGAAVVGLEIQRKNRLQQEEEARQESAVALAMDSLSFSEKDAIQKMLLEFEGDEGLIVTSKIAEKYDITNSVMVNALRKLESAGVIESHSLGMKGTRIKILNSYLKKY